MTNDALYDRRKLKILAAHLLEKAIKLQGIVGIIIVYHSHGIPLHAVPSEHSHATHHPIP